METDRRQSGNAECARGHLRYVNYSSANERTTIGDPHHRVAAIFLIIDVNQRPERQRPVRRGKIFGKCVFSARRLFAHAMNRLMQPRSSGSPSAAFVGPNKVTCSNITRSNCDFMIAPMCTSPYWEKSKSRPASPMVVHSFERCHPFNQRLRPPLGTLEMIIVWQRFYASGRITNGNGHPSQNQSGNQPDVY